MLVEQCGGTLWWNSETVMVEKRRWNSVVEQCGGTVEQCGGTVRWNSGTVWVEQRWWNSDGGIMW